MRFGGRIRRKTFRLKSGIKAWFKMRAILTMCLRPIRKTMKKSAAQTFPTAILLVDADAVVSPWIEA